MLLSFLLLSGDRFMCNVAQLGGSCFCSSTQPRRQHAAHWRCCVLPEIRLTVVPDPITKRHHLWDSCAHFRKFTPILKARHWAWMWGLAASKIRAAIGSAACWAVQAVRRRQNGLKQTDSKQWKLIWLHSELNCSLSCPALPCHRCPALPTRLHQQLMVSRCSARSATRRAFSTITLLYFPRFCSLEARGSY